MGMTLLEQFETSSADFGTLVSPDIPSKADVADALKLHESYSFQMPKCSIHWDDCGLMFGSIPGESIDCVITDPAYWTLDRHRSMGTTTRLGGHRDEEKRSGWFDTIDHDGLVELIDESSRILKSNAHAWIMCDSQTLPFVTGYAIHGDCHDFKYFKSYPVLKRSQSGGYKQGMGYHGRGSHEYVVLLEKGRRRFNDENWPDVFEANWSGGSETKVFTPDGKPYPTAKPLALFERWIELSTLPDEVICDPFLGSGTTVVAAQRLGRSFVGMDKSAYAIETTFNRLRQTPTLFD